MEGEFESRCSCGEDHYAESFAESDEWFKVHQRQGHSVTTLNLAVVDKLPSDLSSDLVKLARQRKVPLCVRYRDL